ncbi:TM2 domain-containing protein [Cytophagales bacterium LB-30]|uniref:TM2 domain-containing protein n=1 Tax=Shiella aurantiaca TaxID=3058365 RepID=A0ABT8F4T3_9BACT|nr:TM2 domain-containing protein [Shiella aurantiaca]MDN4165410.1 TM2 domain-containing protein [Shiella aurantiaca]
MKRTLLLSFLMMLFVSSVSFASDSNKYRVNDAAVETAFEAGVQVNAFDMMNADVLGLNGGASLSADPNPWVAFALAWVVGSLGIHRVYLGGKGSLIAIYILTCGGIFGIVPLIDWIVLLVGAINNDISKYVDNDKFFMW